MSGRELLVEADGGSRGNPGEAGGGALVVDQANGEVLAEIGVYLGVATNNVAEYRGMIAGVSKALELEPEAVLEVRMDAKLVVEQMSGRWKIKNENLAELAHQAQNILTGVSARFVWVAREQNVRADRLANEAMDRKQNFTR